MLVDKSSVRFSDRAAIVFVTTLDMTRSQGWAWEFQRAKSACVETSMMFGERAMSSDNLCWSKESMCRSTVAWTCARA